MVRNKKGSQVGIIMSFTIFIFSLIFIFSIISPPVKIDKTKMYSLESLEEQVINNLTEEVGIVLIKGGGVSSCLKVAYADVGYEGDSFIVKDSSGNEISSGSDSNYIYISNPLEEDSLKIYFSENDFQREIESGETSCDDVIIYNIVDKRIIFEENIINVIASYEENYSKLKNDLGLPDSEEFNILFYYNESSYIGTNNRDANENIFAKTLQVEYINSKGSERLGNLVLKIW